GWPKPCIRLKRQQSCDLQHAGLEDREAFDRRTNLCQARGLPQNRGTQRVPAPPYLPQNRGGVKFLYPLGFLRHELRRKCLRRKRIRAPPRQRQKLHRKFLRELTKIIVTPRWFRIRK